MELIIVFVGSCIMAGAFFMPSGSEDVWVSLNRAGVAAAVYFVVVLILMMRKPFGANVRIITGGASLLALLGLGLWWSSSFSMAHEEKENLIQIRERVSRTILFHEMYPMYFPVLKSYYSQGGDRKESIGELFHRFYPNAQQGKNIRTPFNSTDSLNIFVAGLTDSCVTLVGQEMYVRGRNPDFNNYSGKQGRVQERAILTSKGISYVSEN